MNCIRIDHGTGIRRRLEHRAALMNHVEICGRPGMASKAWSGGELTSWSCNNPVVISIIAVCLSPLPPVSHHYQLNNRVFAFFAQSPLLNFICWGLGWMRLWRRAEGARKIVMLYIERGLHNSVCLSDYYPSPPSTYFWTRDVSFVWRTVSEDICILKESRSPIKCTQSGLKEWRITLSIFAADVLIEINSAPDLSLSYLGVVSRWDKSPRLFSCVWTVTRVPWTVQNHTNGKKYNLKLTVRSLWWSFRCREVRNCSRGQSFAIWHRFRSKCTQPRTGGDGGGANAWVAARATLKDTDLREEGGFGVGISCTV